MAIYSAFFSILQTTLAMCTLRLAAAAILIFSAALAQPAPEPLTYYIDETCENLHPDARFKAKEENPRASIEEAFNIAKGLDARFRNTPEQEPDAYRALQTVFGIEGEIVNSEEHNAVKSTYPMLSQLLIHCHILICKEMAARLASAEEVEDKESCRCPVPLQ